MKEYKHREMHFSEKKRGRENCTSPNLAFIFSDTKSSALVTPTFTIPVAAPASWAALRDSIPQVRVSLYMKHDESPLELSRSKGLRPFSFLMYSKHSCLRASLDISLMVKLWICPYALDKVSIRVDGFKSYNLIPIMSVLVSILDLTPSIQNFQWVVPVW